MCDIIYLLKLLWSLFMNYQKKLKELREDHDLFQKDVAKILNISQQYYSEYENGKRPLPVDHLIRLCKYYKTSADYILSLPDDLNYPRK